MTPKQIWWSGLAIGFGLGLGGILVALKSDVMTIKTGFGHCSGSECQIRIDVVDCAKGLIDVTPDTAGIASAKHIKWTIATAGYAFTADGIQISGSDFKNDPGLMPSTGDKMWRIHDDARITNNTTKYTVQLKPTTGANCAPKDPYIFNE